MHADAQILIRLRIVGCAIRTSFQQHRITLEILIMKALIQVVVVTGALATPLACFAQSDQLVSRTQVRAELVNKASLFRSI